MFTKSSKGQSIVGIAVILVLIVMVVMLTILVSSQSGNYIEGEINEELSFQRAEVAHTSAITVVLEDKMWRAERPSPQGNLQEPDINDYDNRSAYKILSYYYSTPEGEKVWVNGTDYERNEVKEDLEEYFKNQMNYIWTIQSEPIGYQVAISRNNQEDTDDPIVVQRDGYRPSPSSLRTTLPIAIRSGEEIDFTLRTENAEDIAVIEP